MPARRAEALPQFLAGARAVHSNMRDVRGSVAGTIVDHYNLCHMLAGPLHNVCNIGRFVEGGNQGTGSHVVGSSVPPASSRGAARTNSNPRSLSSSMT